MAPNIKLNIDFDPSDMAREAEAKMAQAANGALTSAIRSFFSVSREVRYNRVSNTTEIVTTQGEGYKAVDDLVINAFLDENFQKKLDSLFNDNWERIYLECLTRALQHKANGVAFNKVHSFTLSAKGVQDE